MIILIKNGPGTAFMKVVKSMTLYPPPADEKMVVDDPGNDAY